MQKELLKITLDTESKRIDINYDNLNELSYHFAALTANGLTRKNYDLFNFLYNSLSQVFARDLSGNIQKAFLSALDEDVAALRNMITESGKQKS